MEKNSRSYWKEIRPLWWAEIQRWFGWNDWLPTLIKSGGQILAFWIVFALTGNIEDFIGSVAVSFVNWFLPILFLQFFLAITYVRANNKLHQNQIVIQEEQAQRIKGQQEKINPGAKFELSEYSPDANPDGEKWVGVKIKNCSGAYSIQRCKIKLEAITALTTSSLVTSGKRELPSDLQWSDNNRPDEEGFLFLARDGECFLDIAMATENYQRGAITLRRGRHIIYFNTGEYLITFRIDGMLNSNDIPPQRYSAQMVLEAGKDIRIEKITQLNQ